MGGRGISWLHAVLRSTPRLHARLTAHAHKVACTWPNPCPSCSPCRCHARRVSLLHEPVLQTSRGLPPSPPVLASAC